MHITVLSNPTQVRKESHIINELFDKGLTCLHLRKPGASLKEYRDYLNQIEPEFHSRIVVHYHFRLCKEYGLKGIHFGSKFRRDGLVSNLRFEMANYHYRNYSRSKSYYSLSALHDEKEKLDFAFLSPVFNSISEKGFRGGFDERRLKRFLASSRLKVYALGGIDINTVGDARDLGFAGAVLLGSIWKTMNPVEAYQNIVDASKLQDDEKSRLMKVV